MFEYNDIMIRGKNSTCKCMFNCISQTSKYCEDSAKKCANSLHKTIMKIL